MRNPMDRPAGAPTQHRRRLLAAAMAAPVLFQLVLHWLAIVFSLGDAGADAPVVAYAAAGAAATAGCVLVARLEAARSLRTGGKPVSRD